MAADALQQLGQQAAALLGQLSASERRKLAADLARTMRATQSERIRANKQPDGSAMTPRKPQPKLRGRKGATRRRMFTKLVKPAWLKATATAVLAPPPETFRKARDFAAWLGLVPRQHSTGGKQRLGATTRMGE